MPVFQIIAVGHFRGTDGGPALVGIPELEGARVAGFYTTRVVEADAPRRAMELAADGISDELATFLGRRDNVFELEIESCEELAEDELDSPPRGFTFFSEE